MTAIVEDDLERDDEGIGFALATLAATGDRGGDGGGDARDSRAGTAGVEVVSRFQTKLQLRLKAKVSCKSRSGYRVSGLSRFRW